MNPRLTGGHERVRVERSQQAGEERGRDGETNSHTNPARHPPRGCAGIGLHGLGLPALLSCGGAHRAAGRPPTFGRAKACIVLFMWGGPAQQETWDLKPDAPEQVRGEFRPIATNVPGLMISEHFPLLATPGAPAGRDPLGPPRRRQPPDGHARAADRPPVAARRRRRRWPKTGRTIGAVLAQLNRGRERTALPPFVQMRPTVPDGAPRFVESSHGQGAGWLGPALNPLTIDDDPNRAGYRPEARGRVPPARRPARGRFDDRRRLLERSSRPGPQASSRAGSRPRSMPTYARAYDLLDRPPRARSLRPRPRRPADCATATAGTRTARPCCRPAGWSRRACRS